MSKEAQELYAQLKGIELETYNKSYCFYKNLSVHDIPRNDPALIQDKIIHNVLGVKNEKSSY